MFFLLIAFLHRFHYRSHCQVTTGSLLLDKPVAKFTCIPLRKLGSLHSGEYCKIVTGIRKCSLSTVSLLKLIAFGIWFISHLWYGSPADLGKPLNCQWDCFYKGGGVTSLYLWQFKSKSSWQTVIQIVTFPPPFLLSVAVKGSYKESEPLWVCM